MAISSICNNLSPPLQGRVTANGRVGATAAVYTAAILGMSYCVPGAWAFSRHPFRSVAVAAQHYQDSSLKFIAMVQSI